MELALLSAGETVYDETIFTPNGPAGIFALYLLPGQEIGWAFLNEFVNVSPLVSPNRLSATYIHHGSVSFLP